MPARLIGQDLPSRRGGSLAVVAMIALAGFLSACGGSGEPTDAKGTASASKTATAGASTPKRADNTKACAQAATILQAADRVSANHGDQPVVRMGLYRVLAQRLPPVAQNSDGAVNQVLTALVSLLSKASSEAATDPGAVRALVDKTDPEFKKLRSDLSRACDTTQ